MLRIELDSVRKYRGKSEYRNVGRVSCEGYELVGDGPKIAELCRVLLSKGYTGQVEVWRGKTQVFYSKDLEEWASGKALTGEQPEHLKKNPKENDYA